MCLFDCVCCKWTLESRFIFWNCRHPHELSSCKPDSSSYVGLTSDTPRGVRVTTVKLVHRGGTTVEEEVTRGCGFDTLLFHPPPKLKQKKKTANTVDLKILVIQSSAFKTPGCKWIRTNINTVSKCFLLVDKRDEATIHPGGLWCLSCFIFLLNAQVRNINMSRKFREQDTLAVCFCMSTALGRGRGRMSDSPRRRLQREREAPPPEEQLPTSAEQNSGCHIEEEQKRRASEQRVPPSLRVFSGVVTGFQCWACRS